MLPTDTSSCWNCGAWSREEAMLPITQTQSPFPIDGHHKNRILFCLFFLLFFSFSFSFSRCFVWTWGLLRRFYDSVAFLAHVLACMTHKSAWSWLWVGVSSLELSMGGSPSSSLPIPCQDPVKHSPTSPSPSILFHSKCFTTSHVSKKKKIKCCHLPTTKKTKAKRKPSKDAGRLFIYF